MKIVLSHRSLLHEGLGGGISRVYNELSANLRRLGCEVTLITGRDDFKVDWANVVSLATLDKDEYRGKLAAFLSSYDFDILECSSLDAEALEYLSMPNHRPVVVRADVSTEDFSGQSDIKQQHQIEKADAVIAISYAVQRSLESETGIKAPYVIWDGVDVEKFPFTGHTGNRSIAWVGRLTRAKGFDLLPEVFETLKDYSFEVVTGAGTEPVHFEYDNVSVHGNLDGEQLNEIFRRCSFILSTARFEAFGLSILESMAAGVVPIVPSRSGGLNEFIAHGYNGVVYDSIEELPSLLRGIDYDTLAEHSHQTALDLSSRRCALETLAIYNRVLDQTKTA